MGILSNMGPLKFMLTPLECVQLKLWENILFGKTKKGSVMTHVMHTNVAWSDGIRVTSILSDSNVETRACDEDKGLHTSNPLLVA